MHTTTDVDINAGFLRRFAAFCIDFVIIFVFAYVLSGAISPAFEIIFFILGFSYEFVSVAMFGATIGKKNLGLVVVDYSYKYPIGFVHSFFRTFWKSVIPLPLSSLVIIFDAKKRAAHDKVADTYVAHKEKIRQVRIPKKIKRRKVFVPSKGGASPLQIVYEKAENE